MVLIAGAFVAGLGWAGWMASERLGQSLPAAYEGRELAVHGYVCDVPSPGVYDSVRFSLCVEDWPSLADTGSLPEKLRLSWYGDQARLDLPQRLRAVVVLKRPHGAVNPQGFRYESWLFRHNYRARGTVRQLEPLPGQECALPCQYHRLRLAIARSLHERLAQSEHHPLAEALLMGHRGWLTADHWRVLQQTGTVHLVAISGLHLGLIALVIGLAGRWALALLPRHWLSPAGQRLALAITVLLFGTAFALLAGFTVPTRRALLMLAVASLLMLGGRQLGAWTGYLLALFLVLLFDPLAPMDQGFWLSFSAVAILILVFAARLQSAGRLATLMIAQLAIFVGLWPVLVVAGQAPTAVGGLANLVAIPWLSIVVMPVLLLGGGILAIVPAWGEGVGKVFDLVLGAMWFLLDHLSELPLPPLDSNLVLATVLAVQVLTCLFFPGRRSRMAVAGVVLAWGGSCLAPTGDTKRANEWVRHPEVWVWDVGQGLSVMLRHQRSVLLYDTGPDSPSGYSAVTSVLLPNLRALGVSQLDYLVISHGDNDHAGGLEHLLEALPVGDLVSGEPRRLQARWPGGHTRSVDPCLTGRSWQVGEWTVRLWQYQGDGTGGPTGNNASCVLVASYRGSELILPGDINANAERAFMADPGRGAAPVRRRLVVAPHHGSKTSSSEEWVAWLAPEVAIFSAGYRHRFGHPHEDVVARYRAEGSRLYNTAYSGALRLVLAGGGLEIVESRADSPFWIRSAGGRELDRGP